LRGFYVGLSPRRILPLTEAMNPVKLYEYLSAGRPVVAFYLPELWQFGELVYSARTAEALLEAVGTASAEPRDAAIVARRRNFAAQQTWSERAVSSLRQRPLNCCRWIRGVEGQYPDSLV
jgi:hypothetical protein